MVPSFHHEGPRDRTQSSSWAAKQEVAGQPAVPSSKVSNPNSIHNLNSYLLYDLKYIQVWGSQDVDTLRGLFCIPKLEMSQRFSFLQVTIVIRKAARGIWSGRTQTDLMIQIFLYNMIERVKQTVQCTRLQTGTLPSSIRSLQGTASEDQHSKWDCQSKI